VTPSAHRPVICGWCKADVTPDEGGYELNVVHCSRCGCTAVIGRV